MRSCYTGLLLLLCAGCASEPKPEIRTVPDALAKIEAAAEDAYDAAVASDVGTVSTDATAISESWAGFRAQAASDGAQDVDLQAMDSAVSGLTDAVANPSSDVELARTANAVSDPIARLYAVYKPTVPATLNELDYLGREVALDGMQPDLARASQDIDRVDAVWAPFRGTVASTGSEKDAQTFDDSITAERSAADAQDAALLVQKANAQLDKVDVLEQIFVKAAQADAPD